MPGFGSVLLPGPYGFQQKQTWTLNPSYTPLFIFQRWAKVDPAGPWQSHSYGDSAYAGIELQARICDGLGGLHARRRILSGSGHATGNKDSDVPGGSYDAIRVYLWAGMMDGKGTIRAQMLSAIPGMSVYLANHDAPPEKVSDQGIPLAQDGPVGFSAAILPYLRAFPDRSRISDSKLSG